MNAEIVQGTVQSVAEAAQWLGYTYLYVRMLQKPEVYRISPDYTDRDPVLLQFRVDLVSTHEHACVLFFLFFFPFSLLF